MFFSYKIPKTLEAFAVYKSRTERTCAPEKGTSSKGETSTWQPCTLHCHLVISLMVSWTPGWNTLIPLKPHMFRTWTCLRHCNKRENPLVQANQDRNALSFSKTSYCGRVRQGRGITSKTCRSLFLFVNWPLMTRKTSSLKGTLWNPVFCFTSMTHCVNPFKTD